MELPALSKDAAFLPWDSQRIYPGSDQQDKPNVKRRLGGEVGGGWWERDGLAILACLLSCKNAQFPTTGSWLVSNNSGCFRILTPEYLGANYKYDLTIPNALIQRRTRVSHMERDSAAHFLHFATPIHSYYMSITFSNNHLPLNLPGKSCWICDVTLASMTDLKHRIMSLL